MCMVGWNKLKWTTINEKQQKNQINGINEIFGMVHPLKCHSVYVITHRWTRLQFWQYCQQNVKHRMRFAFILFLNEYVIRLDICWHFLHFIHKTLPKSLVWAAVHFVSKQWKWSHLLSKHSKHTINVKVKVLVMGEHRAEDSSGNSMHFILSFSFDPYILCVVCIYGDNETRKSKQCGDGAKGIRF